MSGLPKNLPQVYLTTNYLINFGTMNLRTERKKRSDEAKEILKIQFAYVQQTVRFSCKNYFSLNKMGTKRVFSS